MEYNKNNTSRFWFVTYTGKQIYPLEIKPEDIDIKDIAHSLSLLCRFQGHCRTFYSVAEHSMYVAENVPKYYALTGLLHDATEAYCGDVIRPIKRYLTDFSNIEDRIWRAVADRFHLPTTLPEEVTEADNRILLTEKRDLLTPETQAYVWTDFQSRNPSAEPYAWRMRATMQPTQAKNAFLRSFERYSL